MLATEDKLLKNTDFKSRNQCILFLLVFIFMLLWYQCVTLGVWLMSIKIVCKLKLQYQISQETNIALNFPFILQFNSLGLIVAYGVLKKKCIPSNKIVKI